MKKIRVISLIVTILLVLFSFILLQLPCSSSFPYPSICPSYLIYLIFNFPAVALGILILQLIEQPAQYLGYVYYISPFINAIWWFVILYLILKWKSKK